jgi:hypothetical protein
MAHWAGRHPPVLVAGERRLFAEKIIQQLRRRADHPEPDAEARQYVEDHFVWSRSGEKLEQVIREVVTH